MVALIPAPADCEVRSVMTYLNAQSIAPIEIHHQLCQQSFPAPCCTKLSRSICCSENCSPGGCQSNLHQNTKQSACISIDKCGPLFLHLKKFLSCQRQHFQNDRVSEIVSQSSYNPRRQTSTTQGYKSWPHGMTNVSILEVNLLKNSSTLDWSLFL